MDENQRHRVGNLGTNDRNKRKSRIGLEYIIALGQAFELTNKSRWEPHSAPQI